MRRSDDLSSDMAFHSSSDSTDALIAGTVAPDDLPDGAARVARLLTALRSPTASPGGGEQEAVATIAATFAASPVSIETARRRRMLPQAFTAKVAAAGAAVLLLGTGAAAATGSLPDAAQSTVSRALSHVSVSVPDPNDHAADAGHAGSTHDAVGPDATGPAMKGLCTAWAARGKGDEPRGESANSTAFTNLRHTARDAGMLVKEYCADILAADAKDAAGADHGTHDAGQAGDEHGKSGESHGSADEHGPAVEVPNTGGIDTGETASDGANDTGADHAAPEAEAGSGNGNGSSGGSSSGSSGGSDHPSGRP